MVEKAGLREAYGETLVELGRKNPKIAVVAADLSGSTKVDKFAKKFPDRFFNIGIDESLAAGFAAGLAKDGWTVFFSTFAIFSYIALAEIRQMICYQNLPVKLVMTHGGITVGPDGASHQALEDLAIMRAMPNLKVIVPADAWETRAAVRAAVRIPGPVYIRLPRDKSPVIYNENTFFTLGRAKAHYHGRDATIIACGPMVWTALEVKKEIKKEYDLDVGVVNMSSIKPIDEREILVAANSSKTLLTTEEHSIIGGLGGAVAEVLVKYGTAKPLKKIGIPDCFGESGAPSELLEKFGLTTERIKKAILD